jgi:hypothetical protein
MIEVKNPQNYYLLFKYYFKVNNMLGQIIAKKSYIF